MWTELLRTRLEALNRQALPTPVEPRGAGAPHLPRDDRPVDRPREPEVAAALFPQVSAGLAWDWRRGAERHAPAGLYWHLETPLAELWPGAARAWREPAEPPRRLMLEPTAEGRRRELAGHHSPAPIASPRIAPARSAADPLVSARRALRAAWPSRVLLLDLETCGWAGSITFLIGLVRLVDGQAVIEQLLARDYREERAILAALWQRVADERLLITFNGKSFDWPTVHDRSNVHRLGRDDRGRTRAASETTPTTPDDGDPAGERLLGPRERRPEPHHFDALHHARRQWRDQLPDCRLQTLEQAICRRQRRHDLGGREIPTAYHAFVRTGDDRDLNRILEHNAWDLVTLAQLSWVLAFEPDPCERAA